MIETGLTPTEAKVVELIEAGKTTTEVAHAMGWRWRQTTVQHLLRVEHKLGRRLNRAATRGGRAPGYFTDSQRAVVDLFAQGLTRQEVAERLGLSLGTVDDRRRRAEKASGQRVGPPRRESKAIVVEKISRSTKRAREIDEGLASVGFCQRCHLRLFEGEDPHACLDLHDFASARTGRGPTV